MYGLAAGAEICFEKRVSKYIAKNQFSLMLLY